MSIAFICSLYEWWLCVYASRKIINKQKLVCLSLDKKREVLASRALVWHKYPNFISCFLRLFLVNHKLSIFSFLYTNKDNFIPITFVVGNLRSQGKYNATLKRESKNISFTIWDHINLSPFIHGIYFAT